MTARYSATEDALWQQIQDDIGRRRRRIADMTLEELQEILVCAITELESRA